MSLYVDNQEDEEGWGDNWSSLSIQELDFAGVFHSVAPEAVNGLLESCPIKSLEADEVLLDVGEVNETLFIILQGKLHVCIEEDDSLPPIILEKGETVGEMSVIDGSATSAVVKAVQFARVLCIPNDKFWRLIDVSHAFSRNMLLLLADRMRQSDNLIHASINLKNHLEEQTTLDPLTTLHNRRWLDLNLPRVMNRAKFGKRPLTILMLDIDHFKSVNDLYGHLVGDAVLQAVARIIRESIRPGDFACRYGGEEFIVILPETSLENSLIPAERIRTKVETVTKVIAEKEDIPAVTISGGLASLMLDMEEVAPLIKAADDNLYKAKEAGRNRLVH